MAKEKVKQNSSSAGNASICAALSYVLVGIIWYFADESMRKSSLARWHAKQGLALLIGSVIVHVVLNIFGFVPFIWMVLWVLSTVVWLCFLILGIMGILGALQNKENRLPIFAELADKFEF